MKQYGHEVIAIYKEAPYVIIVYIDNTPLLAMPAPPKYIQAIHYIPSIFSFINTPPQKAKQHIYAALEHKIRNYVIKTMRTYFQSQYHLSTYQLTILMRYLKNNISIRITYQKDLDKPCLSIESNVYFITTIFSQLFSHLPDNIDNAFKHIKHLSPAIFTTKTMPLSHILHKYNIYYTLQPKEPTKLAASLQYYKKHIKQLPPLIQDYINKIRPFSRQNSSFIFPSVIGFDIDLHKDTISPQQRQLLLKKLIQHLQKQLDILSLPVMYVYTGRGVQILVQYHKGGSPYIPVSLIIPLAFVSDYVYKQFKKQILNNILSLSEQINYTSLLQTLMPLIHSLLQQDYTTIIEEQFAIKLNSQEKQLIKQAVTYNILFYTATTLLSFVVYHATKNVSPLFTIDPVYDKARLFRLPFTIHPITQTVVTPMYAHPQATANTTGHADSTGAHADSTDSLEHANTPGAHKQPRHTDSTGSTQIPLAHKQHKAHADSLGEEKTFYHVFYNNPLFSSLVPLKQAPSVLYRFLKYVRKQYQIQLNEQTKQPVQSNINPDIASYIKHQQEDIVSNMLLNLKMNTLPRIVKYFLKNTANKLDKALSPYYVKGNRHNIALLLGGILKREHYPLQFALYIVNYIALKNNDEEINNRIQAVIDAYKSPIPPSVQYAKQIGVYKIFKQIIGIVRDKQWRILKYKLTLLANVSLLTQIPFNLTVQALYNPNIAKQFINMTIALSKGKQYTVFINNQVFVITPEHVQQYYAHSLPTHRHTDNLMRKLNTIQHIYIPRNTLFLPTILQFTKTFFYNRVFFSLYELLQALLLIYHFAFHYAPPAPLGIANNPRHASNPQPPPG